MNLKPIKIKKILYTTDLSDTALHAFSYAANLANMYGASITILHVVMDHANIEARLSGILLEDQWEVIRERYINEAKQSLVGKRRDNDMIHDALNQFAENVQTNSPEQLFEMDEILVLWGDPVEQILKVAKERNCDLIVMGTHGHNVIEDILGTTARKVIRQSRIPVLTVRLQD